MPDLPSNLPSPDTYEQEYSFWPWGRLLQWVATYIEQNAPRDAVIVDYMCGTGYLLNAVKTRRPDLTVYGCSLTEDYIHWAKARYPNIHIILEDAVVFQPPTPPDVIVCTAGLHHLSFGKQSLFLEKVASELSDDGRLIVGEELIGVDNLGADRQQAVLELWFALMRHAVEAGAPRPVLEAALGVMRADLFVDGEFKRSEAAMESMLEGQFRIVATEKTWPIGSGSFGDRVWVCAPNASMPEGRI